MLQEELVQRTSIVLPLTSKWEKGSMIVLATVHEIGIQGMTVPKRIGENLPETRAEGFRILLDQSNGKGILC